MELEMNMNNGSFYKRFYIKLSIIKALNYNYTGNNERALKFLLDFKNDSLDIKLITAICLMHQRNFSEAYQRIVQLNHSDDWYKKKMGLLWV